MSAKTLLVAALVVAVGIAPVGVGAQQGEAYSGTHVAFDTGSNAVVDYAVNGQTTVQSVKVQSESQASGGIGVSGDLKAVTGFSGSAVSVQSSTSVKATMTTESGAEMTAHDNSRGILIVSAGGSSQYVAANLSSGSEASQEGEKRVVVTNSDGTKSTFLVVGDGKVTVNEQGNVTARIGSDGKLVYRSYPEGRSDDDRKQEQLITSGKAAAEVYVVKAEDGSQQGGQRAADVVQYSQDTTVEVTEQSTGTLNMTAQRSQSEGKVIITTLSKEAYGSVSDAKVYVDGEAAAEASSYSELRSATQGGETSKYMVRQQTSAEASGEVLVAVNHFSERQMSIQSGGGGSGSGVSGPGFGAIGALGALALLGAVLLARSRLD